MITANLMGRLGNQMFQIATAYTLALDNDDSCVFPLIPKYAIPQYDEQLFYVNTILRNIVYAYDFSWIQNVYKEPAFNYREIPYSQNLFLDGYFQSERYFSHRRKQILDLFSPTPYIEARLEKYASLLSSDCVAVHVRRGDYVALADVHANLAEHTNYYHSALALFEGKQKIFFSDDIEWCAKTFGTNSVYIGEGNDVLEMFLFSRIPNKIIANSSFSWWSAWLGEETSDRVIAPQTWFGPKSLHLDCSDVIPDRWKKL